MATLNTGGRELLPQSETGARSLVVCRVSAWKMRGLFVMGVLMTAVSAWELSFPDPVRVAVGGVGLLFFGYCSWEIFRILRRGGIGVIVDAEGIQDFKHGMGRIPWEDVQRVHLGSTSGQKLLSIEVSDPEPYLARLGKVQRWFARASPAWGLAHLNISFTGLTPGLEEVWEYVRARHPEKIGGPVG